VGDPTVLQHILDSPSVWSLIRFVPGRTPDSFVWRYE
jgi:hypothetical protein